MTLDISTPASTTFQDFLNVRNWRTSAADQTTYTDELTYNLNDGPESLIFIPATDSPIGTEMLLAATPLARASLRTLCTRVHFAATMARAQPRSPARTSPRPTAARARRSTA